LGVTFALNFIIEIERGEQIASKLFYHDLVQIREQVEKFQYVSK